MSAATIEKMERMSNRTIGQSANKGKLDVNNKCRGLRSGNMGLFAFSLTIAVSFAPNGVYAFTYSDWLTASTDFKSGFVLGVMGSFSEIDTNENGNRQAVGFAKCFQENKITSKAGLAIVEAYLLRTGEAATFPMTANVFQALFNACKRYLPTD